MKFYAERVAAEGDQAGVLPVIAENNLHVAKAFGRMGARMTWETSEDCLFSTKTWADGITRTNVLSKKYHGRAVEAAIPESIPGPVPVFTPAVLLPVLPQTDTEKSAIKETFQSLDERFAPSAVASRVKVVEAEAAELRAMRDQTNGPTPVIPPVY